MPRPSNASRKASRTEASALHAEAAARAQDTPRGRILRAAAHLFLSRGYGATTMRDLASEVGILSGSIFHHFASKEAILEAVMAEVSARSTERMQRAAAAASTPLARVHALIRCELESIHGESSEAMTLLVIEWRSLRADAKKRVLVARDRYEDVWLAALREAKDELAPMDLFILRRLIYGMTSVTRAWYRPQGALSIEALSDQIFALIKRGKRRRG